MAIWRANTYFMLPGRRHVRPGDLVTDGDPALEGRQHLFDPVEQATAAPGETREPARTHVCDVCGQQAKTKAGLAAHKRTHQDDG